MPAGIPKAACLAATGRHRTGPTACRPSTRPPRGTWAHCSHHTIATIVPAAPAVPEREDGRDD